MKVLLVDDDRDLVDLLEFTLGRAGFETLKAHDNPSALRLYAEETPAIAVVDVNMGRWNGLDLLSDLRRRSDMPVILLTARDSEDDVVRGLNLGAADYITKPFSHRELVARLRAQLRLVGHRVPATSGQRVLQVGRLRMDLDRHEATLDGRVVPLTVTEFRLLHQLMAADRSVVPTTALLQRVWGVGEGNADVVRVTVHRLRRKLGDDAEQSRLIRTVAGVGFALAEPGD